MSETPVSYDLRGFKHYETLTCTYGSRIDLHESSSAEEDAVWLDIEVDPRVLTREIPGSATAHMGYETAVALRDQLTRWINDHPQITEEGSRD